MIIFWITHFGQCIWPNINSGHCRRDILIGFPGRLSAGPLRIKMFFPGLLIRIQTAFLILFAAATRARRITTCFHFFFLTWSKLKQIMENTITAWCHDVNCRWLQSKVIGAGLHLSCGKSVFPGRSGVFCFFHLSAGLYQGLYPKPFEPLLSGPSLKKASG